MTNSVNEIRDADCIFITGSNTAESHPVIGYEVIRAVKRGANLIVVDPRRIPLAEHATCFLQVKPGTDQYVFLAIMHVILREGWEDAEFITARTEGFEAFQKIVSRYPPERASLMAGVPVSLIEKAARLYALGLRASGNSMYEDLRGRSTILYAMGITQRSNGTDMVKTLANLAMLCGHVGKRSTGVNPLRGQSNVQGACDVGCLVNVLPGYQPVTDAEKRGVLASLWGVEDLPAEPGLTIVEAMRAVQQGHVHAAYIMGENPMMSDPNTNHVEAALRGLDLLIVQDIFPSETALLAHFILPAAASLEKGGTFTNTERRVQRLQPVVSAPGDARPDWWITAELAARFARAAGFSDRSDDWHYASEEEIFTELVQATPIYAGMSYPRLNGAGLQWPCPEPGHPGTPILHRERFSRGRGLFSPVEAGDPAEQPDDEYPLVLTTGRVLYHYHSGTMTRRSEVLDWREPGGFVEMHPRDAEGKHLADGDPVVVSSRRGEIRATLRVSDRVPEGTVFLAFHWREAPANVLTQDFKLDPVAKIPEYKVCAVSVDKDARAGVSGEVRSNGGQIL